ncbi:MAG: phosphatidylglycerol lysyltransferase domain-containing protein [Clostridia bacterium]
MIFKEINSQNVGEIAQHILNLHNLCDYTIGTLYMWRDYYKFLYAIEDDLLFIYSKNENSYFPCLDENKQKHLQMLRQHVKGDITFSPIASDMQFYFDLGQATKHDNWADYLYNIEDLTNLAGKKYHAKRNFIAKFKSLYNWQFINVEQTDIKQIEIFLRKLESGQSSSLSQYEIETTLDCIDNWNKLNQIGGVLFADKQIVGLALGEGNGQTLFEHTERADKSFSGVCEMLLHSFVTTFGQNYKYLNREEDMGLDGLRQSKQSYHPTALLDKFIIKISND